MKSDNEKVNIYSRVHVTNKMWHVVKVKHNVRIHRVGVHEH